MTTNSNINRPAFAVTALALLGLAIVFVAQPAQAGETNSLLTQPSHQAQTVPCKPDNSNCPWKLGGKKHRAQLAPVVGSVIADTGGSTRDGKKKNGCKKENSSKECLDYIHEGIKPKPRPKP